MSTVRASSSSGLVTSGLLAAALLVGCGGADSAPVDGSTSLKAVLSIERLEDAGHSDAPSASAMAQFVILPSDADVHDTLGAAGLHTQLPDRVGCVDATSGENGLRSNRAGFTLREPLELLEAGDVSIEAGEMLTRLALNSFPPSGSASGVIYTTPDQSAAPLPPDENYAIRATGSGTIPPLRIAGRAPAALLDVTVGGVPLERAVSIAGGQPLDITWGEGSVGDRIYVELADSERMFACAFPDEDGSGSLPAPLTAQLDPRAVRLSVHRVREAVQPAMPLEALSPEGQSQEGLSTEATAPDDGRGDNLGEGLSLETTVRFDFETTAVLRVQ